MNKALWSKKALALPACAAIVIGGVTFAATPAMADPADLSITSQSVSGRVLTVAGTGTPGENIQIEEAFRETRREIPSNGQWTITYTIPGTSDAPQSYNIQQLNGLNRDGSVVITAAPEAAENPFAVTEQSVSGRTLTVSGTGTAGNTVNFDVGFPVQRTPIAEDGTWTISYEIPGTDTDEHTYTINEQRPNLSTARTLTVTARAEAPAADFNFSLITPEDGDTVPSRTVTFTGTGAVGDTVNVLDADGNRAAPQTIVDADGNWSTTGTFSDSAAQQQDLSVNQVGGGQGQGTIEFSITLPAVAAVPGDGGDEGTTPGDGGDNGTAPVDGGDNGTAPVDGGDNGTAPVDGGTGTGPQTGVVPGNGNGTAPAAGRTPGAVQLPVVSG